MDKDSLNKRTKYLLKYWGLKNGDLLKTDCRQVVAISGPWGSWGLLPQYETFLVIELKEYSEGMCIKLLNKNNVYTIHMGKYSKGLLKKIS